jgi:hypothetical protein
MTKKATTQKATTQKATQSAKSDDFAARHPNLADWITGGGWLEIGYTEMTDSFVRVLDIGGMVWEGKASYKSIDAALQAAERAVVRWTNEHD